MGCLLWTWLLHDSSWLNGKVWFLYLMNYQIIHMKKNKKHCQKKITWTINLEIKCSSKNYMATFSLAWVKYIDLENVLK